MKRSSMYFYLSHVVECKPMWQAFWEPIAAFNSRQVADDHALRCSISAAGRSEYRVKSRNGKGQFTMVEPTKLTGRH